ncbi:uncharacterized protein LOC141697629 [Apium graveolens]|uniref:uncharacterized protein LOC141697629 n=1 Tax=Apium graveolens TaxID=4045 RepID=UPI003D7B193A
MLKKQQHVKAIRYVCAFGLRDKFQPASLLRDLMKNAEEASHTLCENSSCPVDKKDEAIDNILASLREALVCIFQYKLESEYSPEFVGRFIEQLIQQKEDEKIRLSVSNDIAKQEAEKKCNSSTVVIDLAEDCITQPKANSPILDVRYALVTILSDMDGISLLHFLSENPEDHELIGSDILNFLKLSGEPAKLVLHVIRAPHLEMGGKNFESPVVMRSCILLLEQLMNLSPEIKQQDKEDAMKVAFDWKTRMKTPLQVLGFLHLIFAYGLNSRFEASELERHFESISHIKHLPQLCQVSQSSDKRPNQIPTSSICHWHQNDSSVLETGKEEDNITSFIHSENLAKLVLDAIQSCYNSNLNGKRSINSIVVKCFIVLLEKLLTISPQILPHVKKKAAKFAVEWKTQLLDNSTRIPVEVFGFFNLLAVYKVASSVDSNELLGLLESIYMRRRVPQLVRLLGLAHKIPDFVEILIQKGHRLQAIRYIYEFELVGKFLPVPILKNHLSFKKLLDASDVREGNIAIISKQLAILREVVKCVKDHQLEAEYPLEDLIAQVQKLEELAKEFAERSQPYNHLQKKHVSGPYPSPEAQMSTKFKRKQAAGPYPGPEAQTQWHMKKHLRIQPPAGTSFNVRAPAFNSVANFVRGEGAYMQYGPQAQRQWQINQYPQTGQPGHSPVLPSPPFH